MFKSDSSFNVLYTIDIQKTHNFYQKLGLTIKEFEEDKVVVGFGTFDLHFVLKSEEPNQSYRYIAEPAHYGQGNIFYIETDDVNEAQRLVKESGGTIIVQVFNNHWGCKELLFEDPNGYKFALYQDS